MFRNKTAWLSTSVPEACQHFWLSECGSLAGWRNADYLFSNDATCQDTLRIFESKYFLWNKVTVFHSLFLSACEKRRSVKSVSIGHYVLPPLPVQDEVRRVVGRFIWECEDRQERDRMLCFQTKDKGSDVELATNIGKPLEEPKAVERLDSADPATNMSTGYAEMSSLPKYTGDLCDLSMGSIRCSGCKALCFPGDERENDDHKVQRNSERL